MGEIIDYKYYMNNLQSQTNLECSDLCYFANIAFTMAEQRIYLRRKWQNLFQHISIIQP